MKNKEKFAKELVEIAIKGDSIAVKHGVPCTCHSILCKECDFYEEPCVQKTEEWAEAEYAEYETDWSIVPVDTHILVSSDKEEYYKMHFAKYENGFVYAWYIGRTSWSESEAVAPWLYSELAYEEDKIKYRKS